MSSIFPGGGTGTNSNSIEMPVNDSIKSWSSYPAQTDVRLAGNDLLNVDEIVANSISGSITLNNQTLTNTTLAGTTDFTGRINNSYESDSFFAGSLTLRNGQNPGKLRLTEDLGVSYIQSDAEIRFSDYDDSNRKFSVFADGVAFGEHIKAGGSVSAPLIDISNRVYLDGLLEIPLGGLTKGIASLGNTRFSGSSASFTTGQSLFLGNQSMFQNQHYFVDFSSSAGNFTFNITLTEDNDTGYFSHIQTLVYLGTSVNGFSKVIVESSTGSGIYGKTTNGSTVIDGASVEMVFVQAGASTKAVYQMVNILVSGTRIIVWTEALSNTGFPPALEDGNLDISGDINHNGDFTSNGTITGTDGLFFDTEIQNNLLVENDLSVNGTARLGGDEGGIYYNTPAGNTETIAPVDDHRVLTISDQAYTYDNPLRLLPDKVGIGTDTPQYDLDVNGDARITGDLIMNTINSEKIYVNTGEGTDDINYDGLMIDGSTNSVELVLRNRADSGNPQVRFTLMTGKEDGLAQNDEMILPDLRFTLVGDLSSGNPRYVQSMFVPNNSNNKQNVQLCSQQYYRTGGFNSSRPLVLHFFNQFQSGNNGIDQAVVYRNMSVQIGNANTNLGGGGGNNILEVNKQTGLNLEDIKLDGNIIIPSGNTFTSSFLSNDGSDNVLIYNDLSVNGIVSASSFISFTGSHSGKLADGTPFKEGMIVSSTGNYWKTPNVNDAWVEVDYSSGLKDKSIVGVLSKEYDIFDEDESGNNVFVEKRTLYNGVGEGMVLCCNEGGNISKGDLLCASSTPGIAMKQDDDLVHSYTLGKALVNQTFTSSTEETLVGCVYYCG